MLRLLNYKYSLPQFFVLLAVFVYSWEATGYFRYKLPFGAFRLYQFVFAVPIVIYLINKLLKMKFIIPKFSLNIVIWGIFMVLFIPNSTHFGNAVNYAFYIWFDIFAMLTIIAFFKTEKAIQILITVYIAQAVFESIFVIGQFILFHFGIDFGYQVFFGVLPRVSGLTTEPSAFSNYSLACFFTVTILKEYKCSLFSYKFLEFSFWAIFIALLLSTSRIGIIVALSWVVFRNFMRKENLLKKFIKITACLAIVAFTYITFEEEIDIVFEGINLMSSIEENKVNSASARSSAALEALDVFLASPIIGVSLGGVDPGMAHMNGVDYTPMINGRSSCDNERDANCGGGSAVAEILAASGVIALPFFIAFWIDLIKKPLSAFKRFKEFDKQHKIVIKAFLWGLVLLLFKHIVMNGTQSIHHWIHYGILMASFGVFSKIEASK